MKPTKSTKPTSENMGPLSIANHLGIGHFSIHNSLTLN